MRALGLDWTAIATLVLAVVTALLVLEARTARHRAEQRDRETAFRTALMGLALNVQRLEAWKPWLEDTPPLTWLETPLSLAAVTDLLAHVWVQGPLWERIMNLAPNLEAYVGVILAQIHQLPPDASTRGEYVQQRENIRNLYYLIDLYLKQLACYLTAEMRRQRLGTPQEQKEIRHLFAPLGWRYDVVFGRDSVDEAVQNIENSTVWPPFTAQAPEPDDPAYDECRLERLIEIARERSEEKEEQIRSAFGIQPEPGYS